jgi:phosphoribosylamine--glycine ligase
MGVVMASKGYPGSYDKGYVIEGLDNVDVDIVHMGTKIDAGGRVVTAGGRVLMAISRGRDLRQARDKVYDALDKIHCDNLFYRNDIAHQGL